MIKPTVGRIVWYRPALDDGDLGQSASTRPGEPFAAIVTHVHDDNTVNLCVFDADGTPRARALTTLFQGDGEPPAGNYAEWMPFQKGQAKKTEQAEAEAAAKVAKPGGE